MSTTHLLQTQIHYYIWNKMSYEVFTSKRENTTGLPSYPATSGRGGAGMERGDTNRTVRGSRIGQHSLRIRSADSTLVLDLIIKWQSLKLRPEHRTWVGLQNLYIYMLYFHVILQKGRKGVGVGGREELLTEWYCLVLYQRLDSCKVLVFQFSFLF